MSDHCLECNKEFTGYKWCMLCNGIHFQQDFDKWTSGDKKIDEFIQKSQLQVNYWTQVLEWIPYTQFQDVKFIAKGGYGTVYSAIWEDGEITSWDILNKKWDRFPRRKVALKSLDKLSSVDDLINEIEKHSVMWGTLRIIKCYGITQQPESLCYMMVFDFQENGSLRHYLDENFYKMGLKLKLDSLKEISWSLYRMHEKKLIHRDFHPGNLLYGRYLDLHISDLGLCKYFNENSTRKEIYGVLPYIAPEVLYGHAYTPAADIYSFGIVAYEMITGFPLYYNIPHDQDLAVQICQGLRPKIPGKTNKFLVRLIMQCWDARPSRRPGAREINSTLYKWIRDDNFMEHVKDYENEVLKNSSNNNFSELNYKMHPNAIYTSRLLNFSNLSQPTNAPNYEKELEMLTDDYTCEYTIDSITFLHQNFINKI